MTYEQIHKQLKRERGSAKAFPCIECGETKNCWWAYQYTGEELRSPEGSAYSLNIWEDYAPMCPRCHSTMDWKDPIRRQRGEATLRANAASAGALGGAARTRKMKEDPVFAKGSRDHGKWLGSKYGPIGGATRAARYYTDPEYAEVVKGAAKKARDAKAKRTLEDPEFAARLREANSKVISAVNSRRRSCNECGLTTNPGALGSHQKVSGHRGITVLS